MRHRDFVSTLISSTTVSDLVLFPNKQVSHDFAINFNPEDDECEGNRDEASSGYLILLNISAALPDPPSISTADILRWKMCILDSMWSLRVFSPLSESIFNGHRALQIHISSNTFIISSFTPAHLSPSFPSSMCYFKGVYPQSNVCVCVCDQRFRGWWRPTRTACLRSSCMAPPTSLPSSAG